MAKPTTKAPPARVEWRPGVEHPAVFAVHDVVGKGPCAELKMPDRRLCPEGHYIVADGDGWTVEPKEGSK